MQNYVFLCIGTPKIIGDSLGPRVGNRLRDRGVEAYVYGTTDRPVTSLNIGDYAEMLHKRHASDIVIVIDATLGKASDIGKIKLTDRGIKPGGAFHPDRDRLGDIGMMVIVGESDSDRLLELRTRDEAFIDMLADRTAQIVMQAVSA